MEDMEDDDIHYFGSRFAPSESHCPSALSSCVVGVVVVVVASPPFTHLRHQMKMHKGRSWPRVPGP